MITFPLWGINVHVLEVRPEETFRLTSSGLLASFLAVWLINKDTRPCSG